MSAKSIPENMAWHSSSSIAATMATADSARSARLQSLLARHRENRAGLVERDIPFWWSRCFVSVISYVLLLSDVLRSGLGAQTSQYPKLEPDRIMFFGPYAYPVAQIQHSQMVGTGTVWAYKFDSTSVAMRAYAEFFQLGTWHSCLFYRARCPQATLEASTIFRMLDSLVEVMASRRPGAMPHNLTLRTRSAWVDRIYHFILPQFFKKWFVRTNQALYYDSASLESPAFQFYSQNRVRPYACREFWTNFSPICQESNLLCKDIGHLWDHILRQKQSLQDQFSNMTLDMLVVESEEDFSEAAVSLQGKKLFDIAVIIRVQDCTPLSSAVSRATSAHNCSTIAVNEFRYEGASLTSTVVSWYYVVATLRVVGQAYAWLHLAMLFLGCYYARSAESRFANKSVFVRAFVGMRTLFLIPSQVVIYGNLFPICCYVVAHLVDSAMVYQLVSQAFNTYLGKFTLNITVFLRISAVSMRSAWVLVFVLHALVALRTGRMWSTMNDIPGVSEFTLGFISSLTIMAQFRSISFRDTRVDSIAEVVQSSRMALIRASRYDNSRSFWGLLFFGDVLDAQCLIASSAVFCILMIIVWWCLRILSSLKLTKHVELWFWQRTLVPYSAGTLWSTNAFVVSWNGPFIFTSATDWLRSDQRHSWHELIPTSAFVDMKCARKRPNGVRVSPGCLIHNSRSSRFAQQDIAVFDDRCREVESMIYLMNVAVMTDPTVFVRLRWCGGKFIGICKSKATKRVFLIPLGL
ncbi:hypothetical protein FI667_g941, partial [Globisporangium splendens]